MFNQYFFLLHDYENSQYNFLKIDINNNIYNNNWSTIDNQNYNDNKIDFNWINIKILISILNNKKRLRFFLILT